MPWGASGSLPSSPAAAHHEQRLRRVMERGEWRCAAPWRGPGWADSPSIDSSDGGGVVQGGRTLSWRRGQGAAATYADSKALRLG